MAIGARRGAVLAMALRQGLAPAVFGVLAGLGASVSSEQMSNAAFSSPHGDRHYRVFPGDSRVDRDRYAGGLHSRAAGIARGSDASAEVRINAA
jgi:hypothetical protein